MSKPRHLVNIYGLTDSELAHLVENAQNFKKEFKANNNVEYHHKKLLGKTVGLLFSKRSTRTRISTEGAVAFFGGHPMFLGSDDIQLGVNECIEDTTRVISSMTSCIFARVNKHKDILDLCKYSSVPIINSLCDMYHPLQAITDVMTVKESFGYTEGLKLAWIGDANNVINDLAIASLKMGISVAAAVPSTVTFSTSILNEANEIATRKGITFTVTNDPVQALENADLVVTDTWISMGQESEKNKKLKEFDHFQINMELLNRSKLNKDWKFMHCLPRHQEEVTDDVFYGSNSVVFEEAENRLYAAMAVMDGFVVKNGDLLS